MKKIVTIAIACIIIISALIAQKAFSQNPNAKKINVEINPNVELLGLAYFLGYQGREIEKHDSTFEVNGRKTNGKECSLLTGASTRRIKRMFIAITLRLL